MGRFAYSLQEVLSYLILSPRCLYDGCKVAYSGREWLKLDLRRTHDGHLYVAITNKLLSTRLCTKHIVLDICPMMLYEAKLMMGYDELMMVYDAL